MRCRFFYALFFMWCLVLFGWLLQLILVYVVWQGAIRVCLWIGLISLI